MKFDVFKALAPPESEILVLSSDQSVGLHRAVAVYRGERSRHGYAIMCRSQFHGITISLYICSSWSQAILHRVCCIHSGGDFAARAIERKQPSFPTDKCTERSVFPAEPRAKLATKHRALDRTFCVPSQEGLSPVHTYQIIQAWGKILRGEQPSLSIEITRECPLRCPGCYAYDDAHLGGGKTLRDLNDRKGQSLVDGVLEVVDRLKPLHLSIVGGDPLVRYRELELLIPLLLARGIHVQIVTSAFRRMSPTWANLSRLHVVVSIDGLQPEHDLRRTPATWIASQSISVTSVSRSIAPSWSNDEAARDT